MKAAPLVRQSAGRMHDAGNAGSACRSRSAARGLVQLADCVGLLASQPTCDAATHMDPDWLTRMHTRHGKIGSAIETPHGAAAAATFFLPGVLPNGACSRGRPRGSSTRRTTDDKR